MQLSRCPACGASVAPDAAQCPYCRSYFRQEDAPPAAQSAEFQGFTFERRAERAGGGPRRTAYVAPAPGGVLAGFAARF